MNKYGIVNQADYLQSPNYNDRPTGIEVDLLVIHCISLPLGCYGNGFVDQYFQNTLDFSKNPFFGEIKNLKVSCHFLIDRLGGVTQYVSCLKRAWHAGNSCWRGKSNCNDFSLGIELEGTDSSSFTDAQYKNLTFLTKCIQRNYPISDIVGHSDIARPIGRKKDPGFLFDWNRYREMIK